MTASSRVPASIVVGVDGSAGSLTALRWALREAGLRQVGLRTVLAWQYHPARTDPGPSRLPAGFGELRPGLGWELGEFGFDSEIDHGSRLREAQSAAVHLLETAVDEGVQSAQTMRAKAQVPITQQVVRGHPAAALLDIAADADLLVVGSRGHGTFSGALLGSISQHLVTHARCPVVVVPSDHQHERRKHPGAQK